MIGASTALQIPGGAWAERFNSGMTIGTEQAYKWANGFWVGLEWMYGFGGEVQDRAAVLGPSLTANGNVLNDAGANATVNLYQRSTYLQLNLEKVLPYWQVSPNSGPVLGVGGGYLWHWIRVDNPGNNVPQLHGEYRRGVDELSEGWLLRQSLGYLYLSPNRRVNFKVSLEYAQIWTANQRGYLYALGPQSTDPRYSSLWSLKLNWYIPIYRGGKTEEYYFN